MTLLQMNYILEIDRCGSMNKAAQSLFISQSALSLSIQEVEKELGIQVFRRSNRGITLTEDGRELLLQITPIVEQSRKISRYYCRRQETGIVHLSVAAQRYPFCDKAFIEYFKELGEKPVQLSLKETDMASVINEVAAGDSDLGVIFISDITENTIFHSLADKNLAFEPFVSLPPHVFMRRGHPLSEEKEVSLDQLRTYPHVVFTQSENNLNYAEEAVSGSGVDYERMVYVSDRASIYNIMAHTDCVSTGSGLLPAGYADDRLVAIPLSDSCAMRLGCIYPLQHRLSPEAERFISILREITASADETNKI